MYSTIGSDSRAGYHPAPIADTIIGFVRPWVFFATIIADERCFRLRHGLFDGLESLPRLVVLGLFVEEFIVEF